jgi:hypothetical protein
MESFFSNKAVYVVLAFAALTIPAAIGLIAYFWYKWRREEMVISLKSELASRGMSADEIRTVVEAVPRGSTDVDQDLAALGGKISGIAHAKQS